MIDIKTKIHDNYSIEFKVGFVTRRKLKKNDFKLGMWFFVPDSLDITPNTYTKNDFYRDLKSNIRLITPRFLLRDIVGEHAIPLTNLTKAANAMASDSTRSNTSEFAYQTKMFAAIVKSALREDSTYILKQKKKEDLIDDYVSNLRNIITAYRDLERIISTSTLNSEGKGVYDMSGDFICNISNYHTLKVLDKISEDDGLEKQKEELIELVKEINQLRHERGYSSTKDVYKHGMLKKFVERELYLRVPKKRDGMLIEQVYYSLAAGLAMLFATVVAWAFQSYFGNLTWPLFIALIISYMMKDRIKELMRYFFAHKMQNKYFDNKAKIGLNHKEIGFLKEAVDYIPRAKVPEEIMRIRSKVALFPNDNAYIGEKVLLYRKFVHIDRDKMMRDATYNYSGVNDIIRLQVNSFLLKMDNPKVPVLYLDDNDTVKQMMYPKEYYINIILNYEFDGCQDYKLFRVALDRDGIRGIEEKEF